MSRTAVVTAAKPVAASPVETIGTRACCRISPCALTSPAATLVPPISTPITSFPLMDSACIDVSLVQKPYSAFIVPPVLLINAKAACCAGRRNVGAHRRACPEDRDSHPWQFRRLSHKELHPAIPWDKSSRRVRSCPPSRTGRSEERRVGRVLRSGGVSECV